MSTNTVRRVLVAFAVALAPLCALAQAPVIQSVKADAPEGLSARLNATVETYGQPATLFFEVATSPNFTSNKVVGYPEKLDAASGARTVSSNITGLRASTTYYFRAFAFNDLAESAGSGTGSFATPGPPVLTSVHDNHSMSTTFFLFSEFESLAGQAFHCLFEFSANGDMSNSVTLVGADKTTTTNCFYAECTPPGTVCEVPVKNLQRGTQYYWRATVSNAAGSTTSPTTVLIVYP